MTKKTFQIDTEYVQLANTLRLGGAKDEEILKAIEKRKKIVGANPIQPNVNENSLEAQTVAKQKEISKNPFSGKSRIEVLRDAFSKGVTDPKQLEAIGAVYDTLAGPEEAVDISNMNPMEKQSYVDSLKKTAMQKALALPDAETRKGPISAIPMFESGQQIIDILESGEVSTNFAIGGLRKGVFGVGLRSIGATTKEQDNFAALTEVYAGNFRRAMSGLQVSDTEMKRMDQYLPNENKTAQANIEGIKAISAFLASQSSTILGMDLSPLVPSDNLDPLKLQTPVIDSTNNPLGI